MSHRRNNIPVDLLRTFIVISECGNYSKAAAELGLTQPAVSAQMKRLQRLMGGGLFVKRSYGVGLSELGLIVEGYARRILALNDQAMAVAGRHADGETFQLGIHNLFARSVLLNTVDEPLSTLASQHRLVCGSALDLAQKLNSGYVDLAFMLARTTSHHNQLTEWKERLVWLRSVDLSVADDEPIPLVVRANGLLDRRILQILDDNKLRYRIRFVASDLWTVVGATEAGIGVTAVPERAIVDLPHKLVIARDPILPPLPTRRSAVYCREGFDLTRHRRLVEAFICAVKPSLPAVTAAAPV